MVFTWFHDRKRAAILAEPFPEPWLTILDKNVPFYAELTAEEQKKLRDDLRILIAEKNWEGCGGLELTEEIQVTIAAQASLLILNRDHDYFREVESILVYPTRYLVPGRDRTPDGVVSTGKSELLGEANLRGPIILSWADALEGGQRENDGHNVVLHEFSHKLDMNDGSPDGVPLLDDEAQVETWAEVMSREYQALVHDTDTGHASLLDHYGATNAAEFFAVATEAFFEKSAQMRTTHPRLYAVLKSYYHQDPAVRQSTRAEPAEKYRELIEHLPHRHP